MSRPTLAARRAAPIRPPYEPRAADPALDDDAYGLVAVCAAALPASVDLADEAAIVLALIGEGAPAAPLAELLPHIVAKARELRAVGLGAALACAAVERAAAHSGDAPALASFGLERSAFAALADLAALVAIVAVALILDRLERKGRR